MLRKRTFCLHKLVMTSHKHTHTIFVCVSTKDLITNCLVCLHIQYNRHTDITDTDTDAKIKRQSCIDFLITNRADDIWLSRLTR